MGRLPEKQLRREDNIKVNLVEVCCEDMSKTELAMVSFDINVVK